MFINQSKNNVQGDLVAGDKYQTNINLSDSSTLAELCFLYEKIKADSERIGESSNGHFCEQLEHYLSSPTDGDVRGLKQKLADSNRSDQLNFAMRLKEQATKAVMRHQSSKTAQRIYTIILDELHTNFSLTITPIIQAGADRAEVDRCISDLLQRTRSILGENVFEFSLKDLLSLLYFLGGNCHIRWDKC